MLESFKDASAMAEAVRQRKVSPKELVQATMRKAEQVNPVLRAIVSQRYEKALVEAGQRDFSGKPFAGVPIFLKDLGQEQAGEPSTAGSRLFLHYRAQTTDNYVKALENLGFIIMGRTSTPEFGFKNISDAQVHGSVCLPDDLTRNAGGSSGGAAALVSSGVSPLAPASDGGGSIRIPASFNGLLGLKPTRGRIPVGPQSFRGWQGASVSFALTKTVRDTKRLLFHLQTCQMESPFVLPKLPKTCFDAKLPPLRIAVLLEPPVGQAPSVEAQKALQKATECLSALGHQLIDLKQQPIDGLAAMQSYYLMNSVETAAMFDSIENHLQRPLTPSDMEVMTWAIYQSGQAIPAKVYSHALAQWDQYSHQMARFHENYDLLLTPTVAQPAPKQDQFQLSDSMTNALEQIGELSWPQQQKLIWAMFEKSLSWTPYTQQANLTGQPAISLPLYRNEAGLAMGVQVTAAKGREDLLLGLAQELENSGAFC
ncbi:amidase [Streptococcus sp. DD12]|uniref:amidase n=1 Tax=Streptococcus sp. DD12 TaxID=1777880 RepID=UPI000797AFD9|nr:amidase [Streptococcus sp. DD12]KXT76922.1 6-aminohexanoate-cyclic-dimer hydrolase [Streptococcus sp. DD12]